MKYEELLSKFFSGDIAPEEVKSLKAWLTESPKNRQLFDKMNVLWQTSMLSSKRYDVDSAWNMLSSRNDLGHYRKKFRFIGRSEYYVAVLVAGLAILTIIGSLFMLNKAKNALKLLSDSSFVISTSYGEKAHVKLADSTEVVMNSGSRLEYDASYNISGRKVILSGEAFFNVHTDTVNPLIIKTFDIEIVASGTLFNVLSFSDEDRIEVTLIEGNVAVRSKGNEVVDISPGEQLIYAKQTGDYRIQEIHTESVTSWKENKLRLSDTPFEEALRKISRAYNVTFKVTDPRLMDLKYTATFIDEDIEDVMEMMKFVSPITYKISYRSSINDKNYLKPMVSVAYKNK